MKTRARTLYDEICRRFWESEGAWLAIVEAHLAAAYEQGRADERIAQNPPNVAQHWRTTGSTLFQVKWPLPPTIVEPKAVGFRWDNPQEFTANNCPDDPRLKSLTEEQLSQLGRALARK